VRRGDTVTFFGQTLPASEVFVFINSPDEVVRSATASRSGIWRIPFNTEPLAFGDHAAQAKALFAGGQTPFSELKAFAVVAGAAGCSLVDLNGDGKVDIIDFSILLFNWGIPKNEKADFNSDGRVDIIDFSIMLFYWGEC
jgi:hypothetical protein